jgi:hypothetical protein
LAAGAADLAREDHACGVEDVVRGCGTGEAAAVVIKKRVLSLDTVGVP